MSWRYSRALVAEYLAGSCSGGGRCAPSNQTPMPQAYCWPGKTTKLSSLFPSGMTFEVLTESLGAELLTWFRAGFRAKTFHLREKAPASRGSGRGCGLNLRASLARFDPGTHSWKTAQLSLLEGWESYSETWPRWGSLRSGACWERTTSKRLTSATVFGFWVPTPSASSYGTNQGGGGGRVGKVRPSLQTMAARNIWPTPTVQDAKDNGGQSQMERNTMPLNAEVGGPLNPTWVEWLMGWPIGFTDLRPLETAKYQAWRRSHGVCCGSD